MMPDVELPERMKALPRDERGLPIPFIVWYDPDGKPHFTINDQQKQLSAAQNDLCGICGQKLEKMRWFIGGPLSAFAPGGCYIDGPMHDECVHYALRVCPYLAMPSYNNRLDDRKVKSKGQTFVDPTVIPERPDVFVVLETDKAEIQLQRNFGPIPDVRYKPARKNNLQPSLRLDLEDDLTQYYSQVEFWKDGNRLDVREGKKLARRRLKRHIRGR